MLFCLKNVLFLTRTHAEVELLNAAVTRNEFYEGLRDDGTAPYEWSKTPRSKFYSWGTKLILEIGYLIFFFIKPGLHDPATKVGYVITES